MSYTQIHKPVVLGLEGLQLSSKEKALFREISPMGIILFKRNINSPRQVKQLILEVRSACGWAVPIWVDQEGGRVQRLAPPHWPKFPAALEYGKVYKENPAYGLRLLNTGTRLLAKGLREMSIQVNCLPLLDLPQPKADKIIGDRAYAQDTNSVINCGHVVVDTLADMGVVPIIKHIPGHGRALLDSHVALPEVTCSAEALWGHDLLPFQALKKAPVAMTAHVVYRAWDDLPATLSPTVIALLRQEVGFEGILISDDMAMKALDSFGDLEKLTRMTFEAGVDMAMYCAGEVQKNRIMLEVAPQMDEAQNRRWQRVKDIMETPVKPIDEYHLQEYQAWLQN